jgi:putative membrane protein
VQFLKILFWCLLAFVAALFTYGNWNTVPIHLWSGLIADVNLPLLLLVTFFLGFLPAQIYHLAVRWRLRQRLATSERLLTDLRLAMTPPAPPVQAFHPGELPAVPAAVPTTGPSPEPLPGEPLPPHAPGALL